MKLALYVLRYFLIWVVLLDKITTKYMGKLSERLFLLACLRKFDRKEDELELLSCTFWEELLMNPE